MLPVACAGVAVGCASLSLTKQNSVLLGVQKPNERYTETHNWERVPVAHLFRRC